MRSGKSCCELTLFKKDAARFWPLWAAYTALWLLWLPLDILSGARETARFYADHGFSGWAGDAAIRAATSDYGIALAMVYALLCAMAVWSYLFNSRSANMMHTLPLRREGHFAVHFLSGTAFFTVPNVLIFLLTALAGAATGSRGDLGWIAAAMGIHTLMCLFFFSFATLCAMITGHILALPAFFVIFNGLFLGLGMLLDWAAEKFLFGFTTALAESPLVDWLTPGLSLHRSLNFQYEFFKDADWFGSSLNVYALPSGHVEISRVFTGAGIVAVYAVVGLVLAGLALLLYRRRHLETAGDVVAVPWLRPVFQYSVAFCFGLAGTALLYTWLLDLNDKLSLVVLLVLCTAVGFFAARMFLTKSLNVFRDGWKGCLASVCVMLLLCGALEADLFGVERRVPAADQVSSVYVRMNYTSPSDSARWSSFETQDPALVSRIIAVHQGIVDRRGELEGMETPETQPAFWENWADQSFRVVYAMADGSVLERSYTSLWLNATALDDPYSLSSEFDRLLNDRLAVRTLYQLDQVDPSALSSVEISAMENGSEERSTLKLFSFLDVYAQEEAGHINDPAAFPAPDSTSQIALGPRGDKSFLTPQAGLEQLWQAVLEDFDAGALGVRYLFGNEERWANTCVSDMTISWRVLMDPSEKIDSYYYSSITVTLTPQARNTLAVLEELGAFDDGRWIQSNDGSWRWPAEG